MYIYIYFWNMIFTENLSRLVDSSFKLCLTSASRIRYRLQNLSILLTDNIYRWLTRNLFVYNLHGVPNDTLKEFLELAYNFIAKG